MTSRLFRIARLAVVNSVGAAVLLPRSWRRQLYRLVGYRIGKWASLSSGCTVRSSELEIGDGCFVNVGCYFGDGPITIGRNVFISTGVSLSSSDHEPGDSSKRAGADIPTPITIGDGTWIGAHVVVLGNVSIAPGCIIGAGAVVTRDTEPDGVYVGVPARRVRDLDAEQRPAPLRRLVAAR